MAGVAIELINPAFVYAKGGSIDFQHPAAGMIRTVDLQPLPVIFAAVDLEYHNVIE